MKEIFQKKCQKMHKKISKNIKKLLKKHLKKEMKIHKKMQKIYILYLIQMKMKMTGLMMNIKKFFLKD